MFSARALVQYVPQVCPAEFGGPRADMCIPGARSNLGAAQPRMLTALCSTQHELVFLLNNMLSAQ
eukprot:1161986-Pelagomonas_calceolata.AAC.14